MYFSGQGNWRRFSRPQVGSSTSGGDSSRSKPPARCAAAFGFCGLLLLASCVAPAQSPLANAPRFHDAANADLIFRYYSDEVSHVEKPLTMEGPFMVACERSAVLKLAAAQPRHDLAVVLLIHYFSVPQENGIKLAWRDDLKKLGYQKVVFLLAGRERQVDGLPILADPQAPQTVAKQ